MSMTYEEALAHIHGIARIGMRTGLDRIADLLDRLGNPQKKLRFVHVAGTNGKGSTCYLCASVLQEAGYKVGLYVSPYVVRFNERVQINFAPIPDDTLARLTEKIKAEVEKLGKVITEFEFITALAFCYYAEEHCDYVVLEVGLGGRLDATNVIEKPEVSVIASISLDHIAILGNTVEEIAGEKAGIIKEGCPTVLYPLQKGNVKGVIAKRCEEKHSRLVIPDDGKISLVYEKVGEICYRYGDLMVKTHLWGNYQMFNGATVIEAMRLMGVEDTTILRGMEKARIPGRLEVISQKPRIMLDVGHNPDGIDATAQAVGSYYKEGTKKLFAVMGMCADKDHSYCVEKIAALCHTFVGVSAHIARSLDSEELAKEASQYCNNTLFARTVEEGIDLALSLMGEEDLLLVCGSFYVISPAREYLVAKLSK